MSFASEAPQWIVEIVHNSCWQLNPEMRSNMGQIARRIEQNAGLTPPVIITTPAFKVESHQSTGISFN
ncbi:unnamed protein product [Cercopithifilaria johnstoni]|uniref:Uncharacterized protein n=1 Tax=Cercopithifilaria johnstoni TaxID=2874296 RepID=A0A8J2LN18_9BILA|nr:unnamed protein product [Cercopithifilaria johnstoni]